MTSTDDILGKPQRVRRLEFLIRFYQTNREHNGHSEEDLRRYEILIDSLKTEYKYLTKREFRK